ncbi:HD domain-containing protein [Lagierella sp.]|uniref:HD domain-containing protein n=1 Tax=Lagierella sp. TaxID=2849657 RepID=UPI0026277038|nr:HD domain-containing protein [Lagierella sp.]
MEIVKEKRVTMTEIVQNTVVYIRELFKDEYSGHDYFHSMRVYLVAKKLAEKEGADIKIVSLAALLHDVDDIKLFPNSHEGKDNAVSFLKKEGVCDSDIKTICTIIEEVSFKGDDSLVPSTIEGKCVQDADRLDALGAIGIARAFSYGGYHHRQMYNPDIEPVLHMTKDEYRKHVSTTVNHFYEKLFLLKDLMNTRTALDIAKKREDFMRSFIEEFMLEWEGKDSSLI